MDRISSANNVTVGGKRQFADLNLAASTPGTRVVALWCNGAQESIILPVEAAGLTPTDADNTQLMQAMKLLCLGTVSYAGNPNGHLGGTAAANGMAPSACWDTTDSVLWICTTSGAAGTAVWVRATPDLSTLVAASAFTVGGTPPGSYAYGYPNGIRQGGKGTFTPSGSTTTVSETITFPVRFSSYVGSCGAIALGSTRAGGGYPPVVSLAGAASLTSVTFNADNLTGGYPTPPGPSDWNQSVDFYWWADGE